MPSSAFRPPPRSTLFPYTTLFRSRRRAEAEVGGRHLDVRALARECCGQLVVVPRCERRRVGEQDAHRSSVIPVLVRTWNLFHGNSIDRKSTRLNSSHVSISYAVFCFPATTEIYTLSLHDALPISATRRSGSGRSPPRRPRPRARVLRPARGRTTV